jgi:cytochrome b pre-mRNA-processing protein 3
MLRMILRLFRRPYRATINALYGAIVAQARLPVFYAGLGVPDTTEGRFDLIVLHVVLVLRRLRHTTPDPAGGEGRSQVLAQGLFDAFCRDMDHNLREMGVGDLSVPKKMKRLAEAFYGRQRAYEDAFSAGNPAEVLARLAAAVARNLAPGDDPAIRLARYAQRTAARLDAIEDAALWGGRLAFSDPDAILADAAFPQPCAGSAMNRQVFP